MLRAAGQQVFDFTDPTCRRVPETPPEAYPESFDPARHRYGHYLDRPDWRAVVAENRAAIAWSDLVALLLPCGADAHADWALGVALGRRCVVIGHPLQGERSLVHLWADALYDSPEEFLAFVGHNSPAVVLSESSDPKLLRDEVWRFALAMEEKLTRNATKGGWPGSRDGLGERTWRDVSPQALWPKLAEEYGEFYDALQAVPFSAQELLYEAADVANLAMMIADAAGALRPRAAAGNLEPVAAEANSAADLGGSR
jgi:hypothetical protein